MIAWGTPAQGPVKVSFGNPRERAVDSRVENPPQGQGGLARIFVLRCAPACQATPHPASFVGHPLPRERAVNDSLGHPSGGACKS
jgi:hypothetical protein